MIIATPAPATTAPTTATEAMLAQASCSADPTQPRMAKRKLVSDDGSSKKMSTFFRQDAQASSSSEQAAPGSIMVDQDIEIPAAQPDQGTVIEVTTQSNVCSAGERQPEMSSVDSWLHDLSSTVIIDSEGGFASFQKKLLEMTPENPIGTTSEKKAETPEDPDLALFEEVLKKGVIDTRTALDNRFRRQHPPGTQKHDQYKVLSREDKNSFRLQWASLEYQKIKEAKSFSRTLAKGSSHTEKMLTFGNLVTAYGGWHWAPAVTGAKLHAAKCYKLGGKWCDRDGWSDLMRFRFIEKEEKEEFTEAWRHVVESYTEQNQRKEKREDGKQGEQKEEKEEKKLKGKPEAAPTDKNNLDHVLKEASKLKPHYVRAMAGASTLISQIQDIDSYKWARGSEKQELEAIMARVEALILPTTKDFLLNSTTALKKHHSEARLAEDLARFVEAKDIINDLMTKTKSVMSRHRAGL